MARARPKPPTRQIRASVCFIDESRHTRQLGMQRPFLAALPNTIGQLRILAKSPLLSITENDPLLLEQDQGHATVFIMIDPDAIETLETVVVPNLPRLFNRAVLAC